jgi:hypothetical protein
MARRISMATRSELIEAIVERYRTGHRDAKRRILDEFVAVTGYHRKHAIRLMRHREVKPPCDRRHGLRYGADVREALVMLWEASERLCSKRLRPLIPVLLPALERHGRLGIDDTLRGKLLTVSPATMDRLLTEVRVAFAPAKVLVRQP